MSELENDIIIGLHSIGAALKNSHRSIAKIIATEEGLDELKKKTGLTKNQLPQAKIQLVSSHKLQEEGQRYYKQFGFEFQRIPSQIFIITDSLKLKEAHELLELAHNEDKLNIICLDQVTDIHNAAAILRTAAFYGVDALVFSAKNTFSLTPSFYRIASGATEHVKLFQSTNLSRLVTQLQERDVECIGFSEHSQDSFKDLKNIGTKRCLVLGAEEVGLSNAVMRNLKNLVSIKAKGEIKSLNVSVAAAIAMENLF
jgi:23S rRNA (guanosine2251-2'-O)-methyltransferase